MTASVPPSDPVGGPPDPYGDPPTDGPATRGCPGEVPPVAPDADDDGPCAEYSPGRAPSDAIDPATADPDNPMATDPSAEDRCAEDPSVDGPAAEDPSVDGPAAEEPSVDGPAAAGPRPDVPGFAPPRPGSLRSVLSTMTTRMMAERALRAAEAAEADSRRAAEAAVVARDTGRRRSTAFAPFRMGLLGGLGLVVAYIVYRSLDSIRGTLIVIAIAAILAIGLDPAVGLLMRRGMKRGAAVAIVFAVLVVFLAGVSYAIVPPVVGQIGSAVDSVPDWIDRLQTNSWLQSLDKKFGLFNALENSEWVKSMGANAAGGIVSAGVTALGVVIDLFIILILTLYFLAGLPRMKAAAVRLAPASRRDRVAEIGDKVLKQMGGYLGGATLIALQAGIVAGLFSWAIGLPFPWAIGLAATLLDYVPVVGPIIIGVGMALLGFTQSVGIGIVAGGFYLCQHLFEAYWLYPRVMRRTVDISTVGVIVALLIGGALLGVVGAVLAVPVAAAVQLIVREVVLPSQDRS